jgi:hypothetical protein
MDEMLTTNKLFLWKTKKRNLGPCCNRAYFKGAA